MDSLDNWLENSTDTENRNEPPRFENGTTFGRWTVTRFVARGGSGEVYRATDETDPSRVAAVKVLHKTDEATRRRFMREIEIFKVFRNRHFPRVFDSGEKDGRVWFAMEFLEPCDLPESDKGTSAWLLEICNAVRLLHEMGYVHRDLKPANIMRRADGTVVLVDLGLVKDASAVFGANEESISIVDGKSVGLGTIGYAAPEQLIGGEVSVEADIHALGVLADACFNNNPPKPWKRVILKATSSIPKYRFASVDEFADAVRTRHRRRHIAFGAGLVAVLLLLAAVGTIKHASVKPSLENSAVPQDYHASLAMAKDTPPPVQASNPKTPEDAMPDLKPSALTYSLGMDVVEIPTNPPPTTLHLDGKVHVLNRPVRLKKGETIHVIGPGRLEADISGETGSNLSLKDCVVMNFTHIPFEKGGITYDLIRNVYLNFPNIDPSFFSLSQFNIHHGSSKIRFKGPLTLRELQNLRDQTPIPIPL